MWNLIFEVFVLFFCAVCSYVVAKCYGHKMSKALNSLRRREGLHIPFLAELLEFRQHRLAYLYYMALSAVLLYFALLSFSELTS